VLLGPTREDVAACARRLTATGLVVGTAGNVSARWGDLVAITPSGLDYDAMTAEHVGVHDLAGADVEAPLRPSSELPLHLAVYGGTDAAAIVHTHSPAATAVSTVVTDVPAVHYYLAMFGDGVRVAPYAPFGTAELAANAVEALRGRRGALLANHGAVTVGPTLKVALELAVMLEWICDVYLRAAAAGTPALLSADELRQARGALAAYVAAKPHVPPTGP
jgi:L-fuculose-phosphate aldolase